MHFSQCATAKSYGEKHFHNVLFLEGEQGCDVGSPPCSCLKAVSFLQLLGEKGFEACSPQVSVCSLCITY